MHYKIVSTPPYNDIQHEFKTNECFTINPFNIDLNFSMGKTIAYAWVKSYLNEVLPRVEKRFKPNHHKRTSKRIVKYALKKG